ncbi:MAG: glycosyltransferase family 2 protein [Marinobacter sp.]
MSAAPSLSIVVVSYNTREMTLACLRSVFDQGQGLDFELIVVDNASVDGSADAINDEFSEHVHLVRSGCNLGFAKANNLAAEKARGDFLLLLNPDTVVLDHAIDRLLDFAQEYPDCGIWGGRTLFPDGTLNPGSCWSRQSLWSLTSQLSGLSALLRRTTTCNPEGIGAWNRKGIREVDIVSGCFLLIRRALWDELEGFREAFFMYGEDADLCLRARDAGARPLVTGEAAIIHYGGASETVQADKMVRLLEAKMLLVRCHFPTARRRLALTLLALWPLSRFYAHSLFSLAGRAASSERASVWRDVWQRRSEWSQATGLSD